MNSTGLLVLVSIPPTGCTTLVLGMDVQVVPPTGVLVRSKRCQTAGPMSIWMVLVTSPSVGEIDIMENVNGLNKEWGTLHCGISQGGPCKETVGIGGQRVCSPKTCQAGFHTYRVDYDRSVSPEEIRWYLDGVKFWQVNSNQVDTTTWANALHHGFFIVLNVAMGGGFPAAFGGGPTDSRISGIPMLVDYVRVYASIPGINRR